ncbi:MAG: hypothetical protein U0U70_00880 [Chitinophagaceae bacterium]
MRYLLYALLIYLAYQFIFNLVIPVYRASRRIKKSFREMHSRMQEQQQETQAHTGPRVKSQPRVDPNDYIEFEEVK